MHPHVSNISELTDNELEDKLFELQRRYWATRNPDIQNQIRLLLDDYEWEMTTRRHKVKENQQDGDNSLDNLINIS